ncbi:L,D-transpeptidase family protein [Streptomyces sp. NBC_00094]|uniref:L,D-transpeptidase family protein n=1 Tax=Streptomyces sp. NBC_00094 TaxID=2903620 RepID=UPI002256B1D7|nr:L,D-transpeptidase family protein [Streptomyces sp. NBC_00094]MCX5392737.1 L,D-transpeptidase family protein [Streptomyces sp. NBC_00094]
MKRSSSVIHRAVLAAAAVVIAVGCTPQASDPGGSASPSPKAPTTTGPTADPTSTGPTADPTTAPTPTTDGKPPSPSATPTTGAPTPKALMGDGDESEQVRELQARLRQLGHFDRAPTGFYGTMTAGSVTAFQKKQGLPPTGSVDETTWQRLLAASRKPTADELKPSTTNKLDTPDARCMTGRVLCISKESRTLAWMIDGKVVSSMDVRFGSENTPTREGTFSVGWKARTWTSTIYHTPMPYAMFFSGGQAVHYSADFAARGYNGASHGCVNVRDRAKLSALFDQVKVGDKVVVHW